MICKMYERDSKGTVKNGYKANHTRKVMVIRYCEHCNSDISGEWEYDCRKVIVYREQKLSNGKPLSPVEYFPEETYIESGNEPSLDMIKNENKEKFEKAKREILDISPLINKYHEEYNNLKQCVKCPICGSELTKNKNTYIEVGTNDSSGYSSITILKDTQPNSNMTQEFLDKFRNGDIDEKFEYKGRLYTKIAPHILASYKTNSFESVLEYFQSYRVLMNEKRAETEFNSFINKCESQKEIIINNPDAVKNDQSKLKDLLKNIVQTEANIYSVSNRLKSLYNLRKESMAEASTSIKMLLFNKKNELQMLECEYDNLFNTKVEEKKQGIDLQKEYIQAPVKPDEPVFPVCPKEPQLKKANIFNKKRIISENEKIKTDYDKEMSEYKSQCDLIKKQHKENLEKYKEEKRTYEIALKKAEEESKREYDKKLCEIKESVLLELSGKKTEIEHKKNKLNELTNRTDDFKTPEIHKNNMIKEEITKSESLLKELYKVRNAIYGSGIIFDKYCNFVSVSSFYEYFLSGRCNQLDGADGAYNIYESEIRLDTIVSQLDCVIESLEKIQRNQYVIYSAIKETKVQLLELNNSMNKAVSSLARIEKNVSSIEKSTKEISENTAVAAYYSQVNAYYSKKTAELTNALGFMMALN